MRLHIDGSLTAEAPLCSLFDGPDHQDDANQISLVGSDGKLEGYIYNIEVSSVLGTVKEQYTKVIHLSPVCRFCACVSADFVIFLIELQNPPFKLSIDYSCSDGIEEGDDGIWSIVGGKVNKMLSCHSSYMMAEFCV
jgi:hypothetical protein